MKIEGIKKNLRLIFVTLSMIASMIFLSSCGDKNIENVSKSTEIIVSAAASLSESYTEIAKKFKEEQNIDVILNFGGSQSLATGIEEGAGVDIFASANTKYMDKLKEKGFLSEDVIFAKNMIILCKNNRSKVSVETLRDLASPGVKIIVGDKTVPVGSYFYTALDNSIKEEKITDEEEDKIIKNIKSNELSVKDVVSKVLLGEGDVGVVYKTDINDTNKKELELIELEEFGGLQAVYPIGIVNTSNKKEAAREFIDYITNGYGKEILKKYGFTVD